MASMGIRCSVTKADLYRGEDGEEIGEIACEAVSVSRVSAVLPILTVGKGDEFACVRAHIRVYCEYACVSLAKIRTCPMT
jgi:hypothetical protein